jgi:hypothetical protein
LGIPAAVSARHSDEHNVQVEYDVDSILHHRTQSVIQSWAGDNYLII